MVSTANFIAMETVIQVTGLTKQFREVTAVDDLSFAVKKGEVYGFLGQNGAGKSTTIRMLLTLITPDKGEIRIFGKDLRHHRHEILSRTGAIIEKPDLYKYLSALENLRTFAAISGKKIPEKKLLEQLQMVGLAERIYSKIKTFSQGMKQRLGIAVALVHDPDLIILDEPTNGLDPQGIADVRNLIRHLSKDLGKTVFISSHLLNEIELIADSMLIIDRGRKIAEGSKETLLNPAEVQLEIETPATEKAVSFILNSAWKKYYHSSAAQMIVLKMHRSEIPLLLKAMVSMDIDILSARPRHSLEDYFLSLTSK
jgi:ABC-type multidrug transport system ATPase subunit